MNDQIEITKDLDDVSNAVAAINATETGIAELKTKYENVVFDVATTAGMTEAKQARAEIREPRYNIENLRKAAKAPILALGRSLDARARELTERILELETPVDDVIKAEEKRKEDERLAKIKAEEDRVNAIKARIADMFDGVNAVTSDHKMSSESVDLAISGFMQLQIDDSFEEFKDDAQQTYDTCLELLNNHSDAMAAREAEEQRVAAERAELDALRKEKEERDAADALAEKERLAEEQRKADIKAELERKAEANKPAPVEEQLDDLSFGTKLFPNQDDGGIPSGVPEYKSISELSQAVLAPDQKIVADEGDYLSISVCTFKDGAFDVMLRNKDFEVTLSGVQQLDEDQFSFINKVAPACVWTKYERSKS